MFSCVETLIILWPKCHAMSTSKCCIKSVFTASAWEPQPHSMKAVVLKTQTTLKLQKATGDVIFPWHQCLNHAHAGKQPTIKNRWCYALMWAGFPGHENTTACHRFVKLTCVKMCWGTFLLFFRLLFFLPSVFPALPFLFLPAVCLWLHCVFHLQFLRLCLHTCFLHEYLREAFVFFHHCLNFSIRGPTWSCWLHVKNKWNLFFRAVGSLLLALWVIKVLFRCLPLRVIRAIVKSTAFFPNASWVILSIPSRLGLTSLCLIISR